jgi:hypothetical protein
MLPFLRKAADALAGAVSNRIALAVGRAHRVSGDLDQVQIDALEEALTRYSERPTQRTADIIAKEVCRLIKMGTLSTRGQPGDEYLSYVQIRMEREMDPLGAFEALARKPSRAR